MGSVCSVEFWGIVWTVYAIKLKSSAQSSHTPSSLPAPKCWNSGISPHVSDRSGSATSAGLQTATQSHSFSENIQQALITSCQLSKSGNMKLYKIMNFNLIFSICIHSSEKKNSVLFTEFKHHRQNRQDLHVTFCHTDIYAFKSLLNLSVSFFNYAGKWGMAFINCLTHDFLLWQESEPISKYWVFQLCLIINVKLFHMFCTKNKKQL